MQNKKRTAGAISLFELEIEKLVYGGDGLGRYQGKVVFVPFTAPGERIEVRPVEQKKGFTRAALTRIVKPAPGRTDPPCRHFGRCGGCQWQHLDYSLQVAAKRRILEELFHHHFPETKQLPIVFQPSPEAYGYRSRARLQLRGAGEKTQVGFFRHRSHQVEDVDACPLFRPQLNAALANVRSIYREGQLGSTDLELDLACAEDGSWAMANARQAEMSASDSSRDLLSREVGGYRYAAAAGVFFQANDFLVGALAAAIGRLSIPGGAALDLFSGVGFFSLPLARRYRKVVAIEGDATAHRLCIENATAAGFDNIDAVCAGVESWMQAVGSVSAPGFDLILLDPPRAGAGPPVMGQIAAWAPETILYVSCDPQTLCRDLAVLPGRDYRIDHVEGLDMFPQTYHFETIVRLRRR